MKTQHKDHLVDTHLCGARGRLAVGISLAFRLDTVEPRAGRSGEENGRGAHRISGGACEEEEPGGNKKNTDTGASGIVSNGVYLAAVVRLASRRCSNERARVPS